MNMDAGLGAEKTKVIFEPLIILAAFDEQTDFQIERLNADLELERACGKFCDRLPQRLR